MSKIELEPLLDAPKFLQLGAVRMEGQTFEIVSRAKLDTRAIVPFFEDGGTLWVGLTRRDRASRAVRGAPMNGWEAFAHDFREADETSDIARLIETQFGERSDLKVDNARAPIPLPSFARSVGYLCELCLPLLLPVIPPKSEQWLSQEAAGVSDPRARSIEVKAPKGTRLDFMPLLAALTLLDDPKAPPFAEELDLMLRALLPHFPSGATKLSRAPANDGLLARHRAQVITADEIQPPLLSDLPVYTREELQRGDALRFLQLTRIKRGPIDFEVVTPASGVSFALLPFFQTGQGPHFLLWNEVRASAIERQARAPLFDLPVSLRHTNATAIFLSPKDAEPVSRGDYAGLESLAPRILAQALGHEVPVLSFQLLGRPGEPAPALSSELRAAAAVELDAGALNKMSIPEEARIISADQLSRAISEGRVRDPVVVRGFLRVASSLTSSEQEPLDPFARLRSSDGAHRRQFLSTMTRGSEVQRRLLGYSSIEAEQLAAPTYARLMTFLQHEHGLRVAYPKTEADRSFFKAAFRVFMAADRGDDDRALQGLHWSHDAFHFALGNFIVPAPPDFARWYASGEEAPNEQPPEGPAWDIYSRALKTAENEATFFSFWTLYAENLALARHVGKLTYYEAVRDLGVSDRAGARAIYDDVVDRAVLPESVKTNPVFLVRQDIQDLFKYMLGFRPYHFKDIAIAWKFATRDPYRGYLARFDIYEHDLETYLANVRSFCGRLESMPRGLNPILCAVADTRLELALRVWDVTKALRLLRAASIAKAGSIAADRERLLDQAEPHLRELDKLNAWLEELRAKVTDAELTPRNEAVLDRVAQVAARLEQVRGEIWDWAEGTGLLAADKLAAERVRELPR